MRLLVFLLISAAAAGQSPTDAKVFTFKSGDKEHCKIVAAGGNSLLESTYEGTRVAIGLPTNKGHGEFAVFVSITRVDAGPIKIDPREFYGLYSDPDHTRFAYEEPEGMPFGGPPPEGGPGGGSKPGQGAGPPMPPAPFAGGKLKQGATMSGWVTLKKPRKPKIEIQPKDMLSELDIPVNGTDFRF